MAERQIALSSAYKRSSEYNTFLGQVSTRLIQTSPPSSKDFLVRSAVDKGALVVEVWFRTRGCHHFLQGGCTMCNYGFGPTVLADDMVEYARRALSLVEADENLHLLVSPSGSMLDDMEVPQQARESILQLIASFPCASFACETRAQYVTDEKTKQIRSILGDKLVKIAIGLESANPWILKYSINKDMPLDSFRQAVRVLKRHGVLVSANVIVGAPFLTQQEAIQDAVTSVRWAFNQGVDECYLFPVHVKQGTVVYWLWEREMYVPTSLWALVEVLKRLGPDCFPKTTIAWHKTYYEDAKELQQKYKSVPRTCPKCQNQVIELLDKYIATRDLAVIQELDSFDCSCKYNWRVRLEDQSKVSIKDRVADAYTLLGREILGCEWWAHYGDQVLQDIYDSVL